MGNDHSRYLFRAYRALNLILRLWRCLSAVHCLVAQNAICDSESHAGQMRKWSREIIILGNPRHCPRWGKVKWYRSACLHGLKSTAVGNYPDGFSRHTPLEVAMLRRRSEAVRSGNRGKAHSHNVGRLFKRRKTRGEPRDIVGASANVDERCVSMSKSLKVAGNGSCFPFPPRYVGSTLRGTYY